MEYRKVGRTGLKVSAFCLGTMMFGRQVDEAESMRIIRRAIDAGVTFIDTADMYANGVTEEILGKAIKGQRDALVLASKAGHVRRLAAKYGAQTIAGPLDLARPRPFHPWPGGDQVSPNDMGLSRKHISRRPSRRVLKRLGTDYLDIYYAHMPDYDTPLDETLRAMDDLVRQGKVRYLGCSNFRAFQVCKALWLSDKHNLARWDIIQPPFNLLARDIEYELLPLCLEEGIGVAVFSPMAAGFPVGQVREGEAADRGATVQPGRPGIPVQREVLDGPGLRRGSAAAADRRRSRHEPAAVRPRLGAEQEGHHVDRLRRHLGGATGAEHGGGRTSGSPPEELAACDEVWQHAPPAAGSSAADKGTDRTCRRRGGFTERLLPVSRWGDRLWRICTRGGAGPGMGGAAQSPRPGEPTPRGRAALMRRWRPPAAPGAGTSPTAPHRAVADRLGCRRPERNEDAVANAGPAPHGPVRPTGARCCGDPRGGGRAPSLMPITIGLGHRHDDDHGAGPGGRARRGRRQCRAWATTRRSPPLRTRVGAGPDWDARRSGAAGALGDSGGGEQARHAARRGRRHRPDRTAARRCPGERSAPADDSLHRPEGSARSRPHPRRRPDLGSERAEGLVGAGAGGRTRLPARHGASWV
ncbi:MAG: aldo/keto reductase [Marinilabiliales bacterium]|nr:aldo/keto reductase [Marinilabiliales bacterium]